MEPMAPVVDLDYRNIERVLDINVMGTLQMVKTFLPLLRERPEAHIANVSSNGGSIPSRA
jgi:NADP-dependent 3-hydroxy acid dehydrogenase YdfG